MSAHTSGPWEFGRTRDGLRMILGGPDRRYVGEVQIHQFPRAMGICDESERESNASVLLAAVDLLEACADAEAAISDWRLGSENADHGDMRNMTAADAYLRSVLVKLRAAIAKAEGR